MSPRRACSPLRYAALLLGCSAALGACANPRLSRRPDAVTKAPPPSMLAPSLPTEGRDAPTPEAEAAPPPKAPANERLRRHTWAEAAFLPDLLTPGAPSLLVFVEPGCTGCAVVDAALPSAVDRNPALRVVAVELRPNAPGVAKLRDAYEADELPIAVLFGPTGHQRQVIHGASAIEARLSADDWEGPLAVRRLGAAAPPPAAPEPAAAAARPPTNPPPARSTGPREEEEPSHIAPPKPKPAPAPEGWQPKPKPPPPSPDLPEEGPYLGPEKAGEGADGGGE